MFDEIKAALGSSVCDVVIVVSVFDVVLWMDGSGLDSFIPSHTEAQVTEQWTHLRRRSGDHSLSFLINNELIVLSHGRNRLPFKADT